MEGFEAATVIRYVTEGVSDRQGPIAQAIRTGVADSVVFLHEVHDRVLQDARHGLSAASFDAVSECPAMQDFSSNLGRRSTLLTLVRRSPSSQDAFYHLQTGAGPILLDTLDAVRTHLPAVIRSIAWPDKDIAPCKHPVIHRRPR